MRVSFTYSRKRNRFYKVVDITGRRFSRWLVLREFGKDRRGNVLWLCRCDCGSIRLIATNTIRAGQSSSCGCLREDYYESCRTRSGKSSELIYRSWRGMIHRCTNIENIRYENYGKRGITVCDRWLDFENFEADMGEPPSLNSSIERIDNDGNYEPSNCRWATNKEQARNRRTTYWVEYDNEVKSLAGWCEELDLPYHQTWKRLRVFGWDIERAFSNSMRRN